MDVIDIRIILKSIFEKKMDTHKTNNCIYKTQFGGWVNDLPANMIFISDSLNL